MKCDESNVFGLHEYNRQDILVDATDDVRDADRFYIMTEADAVIITLKDRIAELETENRKLKDIKDKYSNCAKKAIDNIAKCELKIGTLSRTQWLARAERYKMKEFIAREECNLRDQMAWSQFLRERTYNQWVDQLLRIANLANKLQNKCRAKAEEYK